MTTLNIPDDLDRKLCRLLLENGLGLRLITDSKVKRSRTPEPRRQHGPLTKD